MAYVRFFRRVRIAPGLSVNLSKHGASLSVGVRGAHVTLGRHGVRRTVGIPGTGIYWTSQSGHHTGVHSGQHFAHATRAPIGKSSRGWLAMLLLCLFLGIGGIHHFYAGRWMRGCAMLVLTLVSITSVPPLMPIVLLWVTADFLIILFGGYIDSQGNRITWHR